LGRFCLCHELGQLDGTAGGALGVQMHERFRLGQTARMRGEEALCAGFHFLISAHLRLSSPPSGKHEPCDPMGGMAALGEMTAPDDRCGWRRSYSPSTGFRSFFMILPLALRGRVSGRKAIFTGTLKAAMRCDTKWRSSSSLALWPGLRWTTAAGS